MSTKHVRRLGVLAGLALLVSMIAAAPVAADPYPNRWKPDRGVHTYCFEAGKTPGPGVRDRVHYAMDNNDGVEAQTVVETTFYSTCNITIDVQIKQERTFDGSSESYGYTACRFWTADDYCDHWEVTINNAFIQARASNDGYQQRKVVCHEIGHSLGLPHYVQAGDTPDANNVQSCMRQGLLDSGAVAWRTYGPHHRSHINNWFNTL